MTSRKRVAIHTLGCKVNQYDSDAVVDQFRAAGYSIVDFDSQADVYVVNTCTVTSTGDKKSRQMVRRARRQNAEAVIVMMGCFSQASPQAAEDLEEVNLILGTDDRGDVVSLVQNINYDQRQNRVIPLSQIHGFEELWVEQGQGRTRGVLKIQDGCSEFCAYCRVPYARGRSRSRGPEQVLAQAERFAEGGCRELVLTGVHLGAYGHDLKSNVDLSNITERIAANVSVDRLRLSSVDPDKISERLLQVMAGQPVVCRHLHIPLQSGSTSVLQRMRRNYTVSDYEQVMRRVRHWLPDAAVTTDVMVGFPGETEVEYQDTMEFVEKMGFSRLHVFPFSPRAGTPAAAMGDQVPKHLRRQRADGLIRKGEEMSAVFHRQFKGKTVSVLVETASNRECFGLTDQYVRVQAQAGSGQCQPQPGDIVQVAIEETDCSGAAGILLQTRK